MILGRAEKKHAGGYAYSLSPSPSTQWDDDSSERANIINNTMVLVLNLVSSVGRLQLRRAAWSLGCCPAAIWIWGGGRRGGWRRRVRLHYEGASIICDRFASRRRWNEVGGDRGGGSARGSGVRTRSATKVGITGGAGGRGR